MKLTILTAFPEYTEKLLDTPVIDRAKKNGALTLTVTDIRAYAGGSFRHIDDSPFGGGKGMILRCGPVIDAIEASGGKTAKKVLLSPKGGRFTQETAKRYAEEPELMLICGHYEGIDARIEKHTDELLSLGDFILTGGELAAAVVTDAVVRLLPGVMKDGVTEEESFENGLLEYPQYTQPADFRGDKVPEVLLSGNHKKIAAWRHLRALLDTKRYRSDLYERLKLSETELKQVEEAEKAAGDTEPDGGTEEA